jgi:hypothetical protein
VQILCTQVLLFLHFRSHEIARRGMRTTPMAVVALIRWPKPRPDERRSPGRQIWTDGHCRGGIPWHLAFAGATSGAPSGASRAGQPSIRRCRKASPSASRSPFAKAERRDRIGASRGLITQGEIISEWRATSNRNGERDHSGIVSDIEWDQHTRLNTISSLG